MGTPRALALGSLIALIWIAGCTEATRDPDGDKQEPAVEQDPPLALYPTWRPFVTPIPSEEIQIPESLAALSEKGKAAYRILAATTHFAPSLVNGAAMMPAEIPAFQMLLHEPLADTAFKSLLATGSPESQLWALCGIYFTDENTFKAETPHLVDSRTNACIMLGCMLFETPMAEIIASRESNVVRLRDNKETLDEWWKRNPEKLAPGQGAHYDIIGGAYPEVLRTFPCDRYADRAIPTR